MFLLLGGSGMFSFERTRDVKEEVARDPAENTFSACARRLRTSNSSSEPTKEASVNSFLLVLRKDSESLPSVDSEASESNPSPSWMVLWLLVKLLSLGCCRVVCSVDGYESSSGWGEDGR